MTALLVAIAVLACVCVIQRIAWRKEAAMLKAACNNWQQKAEDAHARLRDVEPREARFRKALGYYGAEETYAAPAPGKHSPVFKDRGRIAREALQ